MILSRLWSERKGVTLVEILIAFIILTLAAFGAASLISHGHKTTRHDLRRNEAMQLLVDRLNRLSALPFSCFKEKLDLAESYPLNSGSFEGIEFGDIKIGNNSYSVIGNFKRQDITFTNLLELRFPNPNYIATAPYTWNFRDRDNRSYTGDDYQIVKIHVQVTPQNGDVKTEKTFEAVTFVCNMEY